MCRSAGTQHEYLLAHVGFSEAGLPRLKRAMLCEGVHLSSFAAQELWKLTGIHPQPTLGAPFRSLVFSNNTQTNNTLYLLLVFFISIYEVLPQTEVEASRCLRWPLPWPPGAAPLRFAAVCAPHPAPAGQRARVLAVACAQLCSLSPCCGGCSEDGRRRGAGRTLPRAPTYV